MEMDELMNDPQYDDFLHCPNRFINNCHCLQAFVRKNQFTNENLSTPEVIVEFLQDCRLKAVELYSERLTRVDYETYNDWSSQRQESIISKSRTYIDSVKNISVILRGAGICEAACKQILQTTKVSEFSDAPSKKLFQNTNLSIFLNLTNEDDKLIDSLIWSKNESGEGKCLLPLERLIGKNCCKGKCLNRLKNNANFYKKLVYKSILSRQGYRDAITQVIKAQQGKRPYCNKFICFVFGMSIRKLKKIKREIREYERMLEAITNETNKLRTTANQVNQEVNSKHHLVQPSSVNFPKSLEEFIRVQKVLKRVAEIKKKHAEFCLEFDKVRARYLNRHFKNMSGQAYPCYTDASGQTYNPNIAVDVSNLRLNEHSNVYSCQSVENNFSMTTFNNNLTQEQSINTTNLNMVHNSFNTFEDVQSVNSNSRSTTNPSFRVNGNITPENMQNTNDPTNNFQ
ncbi:hypothetical protein RF11_07803 [Thelohanellus kitauei]|uniref:Uncharacterized protein n=1 Tax=Thelohanellus kitauei TaxID=669202 RepID=A0A0C2J9E5_THEKT|nr:hypothetical protein RF11_07803 [Thelohanellus kitauei]